MDYFSNQNYCQRQTPLQQLSNIGGNNYYSPFNPQNYRSYSSFNPYLYSQQQEYYRERLEAIKAEQSRQYEMTKKLMLRSNRAASPEYRIPESELLQRLNPTTQQTPEKNILYDQNEVSYDPRRFMNLRPVNHDRELAIYQDSRYAQRYNKEASKMKKEFPDDMSLLDFLNNSGNLTYECQMKDIKKSRRNLGSLYNRDQFNTVISNNCAVNIDDREIGLPAYINRANAAIAEKRDRFIRSILNNRGV